MGLINGMGSIDAGQNFTKHCAGAHHHELFDFRLFGRFPQIEGAIDVHSDQFVRCLHGTRKMRQMNNDIDVFHQIGE